MKFPSMFSPISIGPVIVPNRFVVPPMGNNFANGDGTLSDRSLAYYTARARGGFGLITIEATVVDPTAKGGPKKPCLFSDHTVESFRRVADACHAEGSIVSVQLQHAGPEGNAKAAGHPLKAASSLPACCGRDVPQELTAEEIERIIQCYGDAAWRAAQAGIDAVEVHCAHGYLLHSFLSPRTNKRVDEYGGCFDNRLRIVRRIIEAIRQRTGNRLALLCRINACDDIRGGLSVQDSAALAMALESMGVDGLHVSRSIHIRDEFMWAPTAVHGGFHAEAVTEIKRAVSIPVITVGRFTEPPYAELLVREGRADLVAFGRQSIADPFLPRHAAQEDLEAVQPCIACLQGCVCNMYKGKPVTCLVNPMVGREAELTPTDCPKRVVVVGGGVGGLLAARICARRGHDVALYEATDTLGGQMLAAAAPPGKGDLTAMVRAYVVQCEKQGVSIHKSTPVTLDKIRELQPDALILATGAEPLVPPIPGIEYSQVLTAVDVLRGKVACGRNVLVLGGGMIGCETADFLGERQHAVTILERCDTLGGDMIDEHRKGIWEDFASYGVQTITGASITELFPDGVTYQTEDGEVHRLDGFDSVVLALGSRSVCPLAKEAAKLVRECYVIGDAATPRRALDATREAFEAAIQI